MKEIGGYFGLEELVSNEYYNELIALNTGRNALLYLIEAREIKRLFIPWLLCNSISDALKNNNFNFEYYSIDQNFKPIFDKKLGENEYLFLVNYYGQFTGNTLLEFKDKYKNIILDNTQAFFQRPIGDIDTIYSCRKYFGVSDGAYLFTNVKLNKKIEIDISKDRMRHILGRFEGVASDYYNDFKKNDVSFKKTNIKYMSKLTHNILGAIDYERIIKLRNQNFIYLDERLKEINKLKIIIPNGPFAYPFFIENGYNIRKKLIEKRIYIPLLWQNVLKDCPKESIEYDYAANILPLPCDQRYRFKEMEIIINNIIRG